MHPKWTIALLTIFIIFGLMGGVLEQQYLGNEPGLLWQLMEAPEITTISNPLTFAVSFASKAWTVIKIIWQAFSWDYAMLTGYWIILRVLGWAFSAAIILSLLLAMRGVSSG